MNHLFQNITWLRYTEALAFALMIYYLYVGLRWYRTAIANFFRMGRASSMLQKEQPLLRACDAEGPDATTVGEHAQTTERPQNPSEDEMLTTALLASIAESIGQPYEPAATTQKLKAILRRYPQLRNSPRRAAINSLIVAECEKIGIARLSEQDVDQWWWD